MTKKNNKITKHRKPKTKHNEPHQKLEMSSGTPEE